MENKNIILIPGNRETDFSTDRLREAAEAGDAQSVRIYTEVMAERRFAELLDNIDADELAC